MFAGNAACPVDIEHVIAEAAERGSEDALVLVPCGAAAAALVRACDAWAAAFAPRPSTAFQMTVQAPSAVSPTPITANIHSLSEMSSMMPRPVVVAAQCCCLCLRGPIQTHWSDEAVRCYLQRLDDGF